MPMESIAMCSNTLYMYNLDTGSSLSWPSTSTIVKLPANKQSKTSLDKGENGVRNLNSPRGRFSKPLNQSLGS
jgi:hypothetical protein